MGKGLEKPEAKVRGYFLLGSPTPLGNLTHGKGYWDALESVHQDLLKHDKDAYWTVRHNWWRAWACKDAIEAYKRNADVKIILLGHSFGGGAALKASRCISDAGVPVAAVVSFDIVPRFFHFHETIAGLSVHRVLNLFQDGDPLLRGKQEVERQDGSKERIQNVRVPCQGTGCHMAVVQWPIEDGTIRRFIELSLKAPITD